MFCLKQKICLVDFVISWSYYWVDLCLISVFRLWASAYFGNVLSRAAPRNLALGADTWELIEMGRKNLAKRRMKRSHLRWKTGCWACDRDLCLRWIKMKYQWRLWSTSGARRCWSDGARINYAAVLRFQGILFNGLPASYLSLLLFGSFQAHFCTGRRDYDWYKMSVLSACGFCLQQWRRLLRMDAPTPAMNKLV